MSLNDVRILRRAKRAPTRGWRRAVHTLSAGTINPGESHSDIEYQQLLDRVRRPVRGDYRIAVLSLKGGVGKTTTTIGLGSTFASLRGDRVIAVDVRSPGKELLRQMGRTEFVRADIRNPLIGK